MRITAVTPDSLAEYLRLPEDSYSTAELEGIMNAALAYIEGYTGIPRYPVGTQKGLDDYEDITLAYLILCQDLYDNRTATQETAVNNTLDAILGMHRRNLVCE